MRRFWLFFVYGVVAIGLEGTWLSGLPLVHFDFILMAVITLALAEDQRGVIAAVIMLGALLDAASAAPFGLAIFSSLVVYAFIRMIVSKISVEIWVARFVWVGLASLLGKIVTALLMFIWSGNANVVAVLLKIAGPQAVFDAFVGLAMIPALKWYDGLTWEKLFRPKGLVLK